MPVHVALNEYTTPARGYANEHGVDVYTLGELESRLVNFDAYIHRIRSHDLYKVIEAEYQETTLHAEGKPNEKVPALKFFDEWLKSESRWLTVFGDYGVGKSWTLRHLLHVLLQRYEESPLKEPLPFFIPLQYFTKSFALNNLLLACFEIYGSSGVHLQAFQYLAREGRIVFLYDSFDEMAQSLSRNTIRENLNELLIGLTDGSRAIMTSRPTYFESRAERILVVEGDPSPRAHKHDQIVHSKHRELARHIQEKLESVQYARLNV